MLLYEYQEKSLGKRLGESEKDDNARGMRVQKFFDDFT
jgi:hypothetical protein